MNITHSAASEEWPAWSLDGKRIAFSSDREGQPELYLMNPRQIERRPRDDERGVQRRVVPSRVRA